MKTTFNIIKLDPSRWPEYKALRLESLETEPYAFLGTVPEESAYPDTEWQERLEKSLMPNEHIMLFAEKACLIVGMIGILFNKNKKNKHIVTLVSFYVTPAQRSQGIGKALMQHAFQAIEKRGYVTKITLDVTLTQEATIKLYESFGFLKVALLKNNINVENVYYDEYLMEKIL